MIREDRHAGDVQVREARPDRGIGRIGAARLHELLLNPDEVVVQRGVVGWIHHAERRRLAACRIGDLTQQRRHRLAVEAQRRRAVVRVERRAGADVDILALECRVARRRAVDAAVGRHVGAVVEGVEEAVRKQRIGRVVGVEQPRDVLPCRGVRIVHARLEQTISRSVAWMIVSPNGSGIGTTQ